MVPHFNTSKLPFEVLASGTMCSVARWGPIGRKSTMPPVWSEDHLRLAIEAAGVALWSWNVDNDKLTMDKRGYVMWGVPVSSEVSFEDLSARIHPSDRDRVRAAFAATRAISGPYEIDFRILIGEAVQWISARGQGADVGMVGRLMFGIFLDVTGRKQAEEGHELLAGEMSHRLKICWPLRLASRPLPRDLRRQQIRWRISSLSNSRLWAVPTISFGQFQASRERPPFLAI